MAEESDRLTEQTKRLIELESELYALRRRYDRDQAWWSSYQNLASNLLVSKTPQEVYDAVSQTLVKDLEMQAVLVLELNRDFLSILSLQPARSLKAMSVVDAELAAALREARGGVYNGTGNAFAGLAELTGLQRFLWCLLSVGNQGNAAGSPESSDSPRLTDLILVAGFDARRARYREPFDQSALAQFQRICLHLQSWLSNVELVRRLDSQHRELSERLATITTQAALIRQLSAPVLEVWQDILILPIIGELDPERARDIMQDLLARLSQTRARCIILDVTGMSEIDSIAADHLLKVTAAAQLLGARCVLTGVRASLAIALVSIGVDLGQLKTFRNLRAGLWDCVQGLQSRA